MGKCYQPWRPKLLEIWTDHSSHWIQIEPKHSGPILWCVHLRPSSTLITKGAYLIALTLAETNDWIQIFCAGVSWTSTAWGLAQNHSTNILIEWHVFIASLSWFLWHFDYLARVKINEDILCQNLTEFSYFGVVLDQ